MNCPSEKNLQAYLQGELDERQRDSLEQHVTGCGHCHDVLERLESADQKLTSKPKGLVNDYQGIDIHPDLLDELHASGYDVVERLGGGGFGTVFRAREREANRDVAIKILNPNLFASGAAASQFGREIEIQANIDRDRIVPVYKAGRFPNGQRYVVMRFMPAGSLRKLIAKSPEGVPPLKAARILYYCSGRH